MYNVYHIEGVTDLEKMKTDARRHQKSGVSTQIHSHRFGEPCDMRVHFDFIVPDIEDLENV
jgi:hypothetical protein